MPEEAGQREVFEAAEALAADGRYTELPGRASKEAIYGRRGTGIAAAWDVSCRRAGIIPRRSRSCRKGGELLLDGALVAIGGGAAA